MGAMGKGVDYEALLRDAGLRITKPRRIILEILHDSARASRCRADLQRAVAMDSRISLATVYRTIEGWKAARSSVMPLPADRRGSSSRRSTTII